MFDGNLFFELLRTRAMYDLATELTEARRRKQPTLRSGYVSKRVGELLIALGERLKANAQRGARTRGDSW